MGEKLFNEVEEFKKSEHCLRVALISEESDKKKWREKYVSLKRKLSENIYETLECPVCLDTIIPPKSPLVCRHGVYYLSYAIRYQTKVISCQLKSVVMTHIFILFPG